MSTIGFIGGGNMAEALIKGIIEAGLYKAENITISDIRSQRLDYLAEKYSIQITVDNRQLAAGVETVLLSIKPQNMAEVLKQIAGAINKDALVVSIAAGIKVAAIANALGDVPIVRVMPNTPALIGEGASVLFANKKAGARLESAEKIFSAVGKAFVIDDEQLIDAVTAVSGSGPAYYFLLTEEMIKAAVKLGLDEKIATQLVLQTAKGSALLACQAETQGKSVAELRRNVTSPGGTTEAALKVFAEGDFGKLISAALKAACDRSRQLSEQ